MSFPDQVSYGGWSTEEWTPEEPRDIPKGYSPDQVAPYLSNVEVLAYDAEADRTIPIDSDTVRIAVNAANGFDPEDENTIPVSGEEIRRIDQAQKAAQEAQKTAETQACIERLAKVSDFAGAILLHMYADDQKRLANEVSTGPKREPRYVPTVIVQELDVSEANSGQKGALRKMRDILSERTITKEPQALLWAIPGLSREVDGKTEHIAVAANLANDQTLPVGSLMVVKGDISRPVPGVPVETGLSTEAFRKKFPNGSENEQLEAYFEEPENNFRTLPVEPWKPAGQTWDGEKIEGNSSFDPEEIENALRNLWVNNKLGTAGKHFGFRVPEKL